MIEGISEKSRNPMAWGERDGTQIQPGGKRIQSLRSATVPAVEVTGEDQGADMIVRQLKKQLKLPSIVTGLTEIDRMDIEQ